MKDRSTGLTFIAGIVVGAAVGALAGLLFAPDSGAETRKKISAKSKEIADEMHKKFDGLKGTVNETLDELKRAATKKA